MKYIPLLVSLFSTLASALAVPTFVEHHLLLYAVLNGVAQVLHAVMPSVTISNSQKSLFVLVLALGLGVSLAPQRAAAQDTLPTNIFGAGATFNNGASPAIAGTGLYAHQASGGTYVFSVVDALPATLKPFTVTTNLGGGIAQRVFTIGKVPVFIPTSAGVSFNGTNTGWAWTTGALAAVKVKPNFYVMPMVRVVKSSVSGGSGYQPIVGVLFAWGK